MSRPPLTPALMFQGTGSDVGKSLLVAGLCRLFARQGLRVRPFKPQNMSNNAAVTADGGEIGRAQALQARACGISPSVHMNPVLLKPQSEQGAQVVIQGRVEGVLSARACQARKKSWLPAVLDSFQRVAADADLVLVEGAGSAAEINLRAGDIANMGFAQAADLPVVLVGDIDRGGVIAAVAGTWALLPELERQRLKGFLINKFRGDSRLFDSGLAAITAHTGLPGFGVVPWFADAARLPAEDGVALQKPALRRLDGRSGGRIRIVVPQFSHIANFDDLDPLAQEPEVALELIPRGRPLPQGAALILLPGSKNTRSDLALIRREGWDLDIQVHLRHGGRVLGLCGGYQMLGQVVADPAGLEGDAGHDPGLGLLDVVTTLHPEKTLRPRSGYHAASGQAVSGYEIHLGQTQGPDTARPFLWLAAQAVTQTTALSPGSMPADGAMRPDGAVRADGRVAGTYLHGVFASDGFRQAFLAGLSADVTTTLAYEATIEATLDALAGHLAAHLDTTGLLALAQARHG